MRLATRANGTPDGELIVVSAAGDRFLPASDIVPTLLAALEQWSAVAPMLQARAELIAAGQGEPIDPLRPLPRPHR